jgi:DNA-binding response OmpR family regulator
MRVLLVEDERLLADILAKALRKEALTVDVAYDGHQALDRLDLTDYDVIVLDRDLPGVHGDKVCRQIVTRRLAGRILMLTASGTVRDRVEGLGLGADDYLGKPFAYEELLARILALGRRSGPALPPRVEAGDLVLDVPRRHASRGGRLLHLSHKEFAVLEVLMRADGTVQSVEDLLDQVWENNIGGDANMVRVTLSRLRAKLGDPSIIQTIPGSGYRFTPPRPADEVS